MMTWDRNSTEPFKANAPAEDEEGEYVGNQNDGCGYEKLWVCILGDIGFGAVLKIYMQWRWVILLYWCSTVQRNVNTPGRNE
jgi:hypothetical protein